MSDLDRRIATEVMGEDEPPALRWGNEPWLDIPVFEDGSLVSADEWKSAGGNWRVVSIFEHGDAPEWQPVSFSSSLDEALRAVDKYFAETQPKDSRYEPEMFMEYRPTANALFCASLDGEFGLGQTLPEAICNLLLALKSNAVSREDFEADIDAYTQRLNSRMKEKYRANSHKPLMSKMTDLELQHELEGEFDETMAEVTWAALGRYNAIFKKPPDDLELETSDVNIYLCETWRRAGALEVLREQARTKVQEWIIGKRVSL